MLIMMLIFTFYLFTCSVSFARIIFPLKNWSLPMLMARMLIGMSFTRLSFVAWDVGGLPHLPLSGYN